VTFVLDASLTLTWVFGDEATAETDRLAERVRDHGAVAPSIWPLEVLNVLVGAERRGRMSEADLRDAVTALRALPVEVEASPGGRVWNDVVMLARQEKLTIYDASYLELALRRGLPLATLDKDLRAAAVRQEGTVLP
jgi:predicted nucleic acid-binding protein